jgi:hypothetical protein
MATGDLVTADWQMEYRGLALGDGSPYLITQVEGLLDLPGLTTADRQRLRRHGLIPGDDFANGRTVVISLEISDEAGVDFDTAVTALMAATAPGSDEQPLVFQIPGVAGGGKRQLMARPRRRSLPIGRDFYYKLPVAQIEFECTNPRILNRTLETATTSLPTAAGGLNFNLTFNASFGATSTSGLLNLTNQGTFDAPPQIRFDGPVTNPRVENLTQDKRLQLDITLAAGEFLLLDAEARTVLLNGTASRYNTLTTTSEWFDLQPGSNSLAFQASTPSSATITISWRSAWV